jgi:hypothetical protein
MRVLVDTPKKFSNVRIAAPSNQAKRTAANSMYVSRVESLREAGLLLVNSGDYRVPLLLLG